MTHIVVLKKYYHIIIRVCNEVGIHFYYFGTESVKQLFTSSLFCNQPIRVLYQWKYLSSIIFKVSLYNLICSI